MDQAKNARPTIKKVSRPSEVPLSFAQRRLWFLHCLEGPSPTYNIPLVIRLSGKLNEEALQGAFYDVVEKHETLRTIFPNVLGSSYQKILDIEDLNLEMIKTKICKEELESVLAEAIRYSFNLDVEPAVRLQLFTVNENEHVLLILLHHIVGMAGHYNR